MPPYQKINKSWNPLKHTLSHYMYLIRFHLYITLVNFNLTTQPLLKKKHWGPAPNLDHHLSVLFSCFIPPLFLSPLPPLLPSCMLYYSLSSSTHREWFNFLLLLWGENVDEEDDDESSLNLDTTARAVTRNCGNTFGGFSLLLFSISTRLCINR